MIGPDIGARGENVRRVCRIKFELADRVVDVGLFEMGFDRRQQHRSCDDLAGAELKRSFGQPL
jgi:hypothetical protein